MVKFSHPLLSSVTTDKIDFDDINAKSFYILGKIHEQQKNTAKAAERYEKFLSLWKDADPGLPEAGVTKKRLAVLKIH